MFRPSRRNRVSFRNTGLFPHFTVRAETSVWYAQYPNAVHGEIAKRVQEWRESSASIRLQRATRNQLSGGQRQRVGVARAWPPPCHSAMDEPFGAPIRLPREELQREFLSLQQRLQKTVVFVTHAPQ